MPRDSARLPGRAALLVALCALVLLALPGGARATEAPPAVPASYQMMAENDLFQFYVDSATLAFKVLDKRSGYLWHSGIDELLEGDRLNTSWRAFAQSGLSIEYFDERAINRRVSIANSEHTLAVTPIEQGFAALVTFSEYGITIGLRAQLEADGVRVEIPFDTIREESSSFRLARAYLYPFLGATRGGSVPGYMLLPDGIGSLIRFADSTRAQTMFYSRYYGPDLGMIGIQPFDQRINTPYPISFPVFGMAHGEGQNAFISVVERGAAYGELQVHPAGIITNFNFLYTAFIYNETYFQATNRSGAGVTTTQRQPNAFNAVVHYRFLTGSQAHYVGMAHSYQQYLLDKGLLRRYDDPNPNIGIRLEFLGGDKERILFWDRFIPMTTIGQMRAILDSLNIPNPEVIYYGWQPLGASNMPPTWLAVESGLGSVDELRALAEDIAAAGGHFSLYLEPQTALWGEAGYSTRSDVAISITNINIEGYNRHYSHFFTFAVLRQRYSALVGDIAGRLNVGLALDTIGSTLYSDFREGHMLNREDTIAAYQALLAESPLRLSFYRPNDYLFGFAQAYYDMPLRDNGYIYTSQSVPFLPIVLAGYLPYYGPALNFSSDRQNDLLRLVEYGIYPAYFLTHAPTANMLNTRSAWIYTSSYEQWGAEILSTYQWMNTLLAPLRGQRIMAHEMLAADVYATTYANGRQIIVNYSDQPFVRGEISVESYGALLVESGL
ncbi:MAG: hypothetical protein HXY40_05275 [Chloroflexi bacterium]|nr:hypothetical protein [Chloroflexota bacterium]